MVVLIQSSYHVMCWSSEMFYIYKSKNMFAKSEVYLFSSLHLLEYVPRFLPTLQNIQMNVTFWIRWRFCKSDLGQEAMSLEQRTRKIFESKWKKSLNTSGCTSQGIFEESIFLFFCFDNEERSVVPRRRNALVMVSANCEQEFIRPRSTNNILVDRFNPGTDGKYLQKVKNKVITVDKMNPFAYNAVVEEKCV